MLIAFNKPFGVLSQFTSDGMQPTLADYIAIPGVYAAGRLDADSEGLLLLTDDGALQRRIADPSQRRDPPLVKRYWAQVEGIPGARNLARFADGLVIGEGAQRFRAQPSEARRIDDPAIAERVPAIRVRRNIPTCWIEISIREGKNRQVRRMTAAVGHPTLRLIRVGIGPLDLFRLALAPGIALAIEADRLGFAPSQRKAASGATRG